MTNPTDKIRQARYLCLAADCAEKSNNAKVQESKNLYKNVAEQVSDKNPEISYSKIHQRFSERLNEPEALTNPEKYLGPNYQDVLNFWIYLDSLSGEEKRKILGRYCALDDYVRDFAIDIAINEADKNVGFEFRSAAWGVTGWVVFDSATLELIGDVDDKVAYDLIMSHREL